MLQYFHQFHSLGITFLKIRIKKSISYSIRDGKISVDFQYILLYTNTLQCDYKRYILRLFHMFLDKDHGIYYLYTLYHVDNLYLIHIQVYNRNMGRQNIPVGKHKHLHHFFLDILRLHRKGRECKDDLVLLFLLK